MKIRWKLRLFIYGLLFGCIWLFADKLGFVDTLKVNPNIELRLITNTNLGPYLHEPIIRLDTGGSFCTGVVIDNNYALTAAHCVNIDDTIHVYDRYNVDTMVIAHTAALDTLRDIALVIGDFRAFKPVTVDFSGLEVSTGMIATSCGFPAGQLTLYCIDLVHVGNRYFQYRMTGLPLFQGCSGGPVFNRLTGHLIGINSAVDHNSIIISPLVGFKDELGL